MNESSSDCDTNSTDRIDAIQTRWSLICLSVRGDDPTAQKARQILVLRYAAAIRRYIRAMVRSEDLADELSQEVVLKLMQGGFSSADRSRGRFRDLLISSVRNLVRSHYSRQHRQRAEPLADDLVDEHQSEAEESAWLAAWRQTLLDQSFRRLEHEGPGTAYAEALRVKLTSPDADSAELADRLSEKTGRQFTPESYRQILHRARRRLVSHLRDEIREGLRDESPEAVDDELAALALLDHIRDSP
jgi:hypothetical protein